ncbi:6-hydroxymethylpterin diphosphokinase MptE-like protein [Sulfurimonas sp. C5]|uniref:motility associated factor glycosyltransferase family protein n=1 Tax=Sulfurimonas sp. C5 TaxID=3036947 RepID=UPI002458F23F|nr:6-hydroxymethylpterin diphosphokinase MptE-like protein [Sulfurimonas sp. C5]MDH4944756.1 DUF115 domain-containing protein [Sulfurimonas sp. C5]
MNDIENKALERYTKNSEFLAQNHPDVFNKIKILEDGINHGLYQEKYALEYQNKYFDVVDLKSGQFLYNTNSIQVSDQLTSLVNFDKNSYLFEGFGLYYNYEQGKDSFLDTAKGAEGIYPLMTYYIDNLPKNATMNEIEKFIFIGVGLGLHILQVDKKIHAEEYFIIEDDLELFRLSLFTTPYYKIKGKLSFSIQEKEEQFTRKFQLFLQLSFFRNKFLKYSYFPAHSKEKFDFIKHSLASQAFSVFPYKTRLMKYLRPLEYIKNNYKFINLSKQFKKSSLSEKPCIVLGAGPSFEKHIDWLKENQDSFIIIAVSAVLKKLHEYNIKPDIVTHLDGFAISAKHFEGFETKNFLNNSILLAGSFVQQNIIDHFVKTNVYIYEENQTNYHKGFDSINGSCVGSTSVVHSALLNFDKIYLLGVDLAITKDGQTHVSSHIHSKTVDLNKIKESQTNISLAGSFFNVPGNLEKTVYTNPTFYGSILNLNNIIPHVKNETQTIYNLSEGAYFSGTEPFKNFEQLSDSLGSYDKKEIHAEIMDLFQSYSNDNLSSDELKEIAKKLEFVTSVKHIITTFQEKKFLHANHYLHALISLMLDILQPPTITTANLIDIYDQFFSYSMPLIFDLFNTKELKEQNKHIENINKLIIDEMMEVVTIYEEKITEFLN